MRDAIFADAGVREKLQEVRWAVCQNCEDGAAWDRIREALDALVLTARAEALAEVARRVELLLREGPDESPDGRPIMVPDAFGNYLDRAAVLALLDGGTDDRLD